MDLTVSRPASFKNWHFTLMKCFVFSAGVILAITGVAKGYSALGESRALGLDDPVFDFPFRQLMLLVGGLEIVIAVLCLCTRHLVLNTSLVAWISTNFLAYRMIVHWFGWQFPCSCLGNLTDRLPIAPQTIDIIIKSMLAYLLVGGYASLYWLWKTRRRESANVEP